MLKCADTNSDERSFAPIRAKTAAKCLLCERGVEICVAPIHYPKMPGTSTAEWLIILKCGTSTAKMVHYTRSLLAASLQPNGLQVGSKLLLASPKNLEK